MAQSTVFSTREIIDTDSDSDSNGSRSGSGRLYIAGSDHLTSKKKTTARRRSTSHHLLMDAIEGGGGGSGSSEEEKIPLPDYERLSQSMRLPEDTVEEEEEPAEPVKALMQSASQGQKPIARKLIDKVFKKDADHHKEKEKDKDKDKDRDGGDTPPPASKEKKKRSSWLPDPEKRWPIQGWS